MDAGNKTKIALPSAFVVNVYVWRLFTRPVLTDIIEGILHAVCSGKSREAIA